MLPVMKLAIVGFKIMSRPMNNYLKRIFTHRFVFMHRFIGICGQKAHEFEIYMNRKVVNNNQKLDFYIKPLSEEAAFNKGVDYFVEIVFFYGVLIGIAFYEVVKSHNSSERQKAQIKKLEEMCIKNDEKTTILIEELRKSKVTREVGLEEMSAIKKELEELRKQLVHNSQNGKDL